LLREAIESLWRQSLRPEQYEIIVTDNQSNDGTAEMLCEMQPASPCALIYHRMPENRGPARSRNTGASLASGEVLALTDSDCRVDADWLANGLASFADPSVGMATGAVYHKPEQRQQFFQRSHDPITQESPAYPAQNVFYRKIAFDELGGFDESLSFRDFRGRVLECADTDLGWRFRKSRWQVVFRKDAVVFHERERQTSVSWLLEPVYLFAVPLLVRRHPQIRARLLRWKWFLSALHPPFYIFWAGVTLALLRNEPWWLLLGLPYVLVVARACRRRWALSLLETFAWVPLIGARQVVGTAALLYGSVRFRRLVL
jgi:glycosyltransferase involved in cell wall biosynthesis